MGNDYPKIIIIIMNISIIYIYIYIILKNKSKHTVLSINSFGEIAFGVVEYVNDSLLILFNKKFVPQIKHCISSSFTILQPNLFSKSSAYLYAPPPVTLTTFGNPLSSICKLFSKIIIIIS